MNDRVIPVIVLLLNFLLSLVVGFLPGISWLAIVWSFASAISLIMVAGWVYEDGKRIDKMEKYLWRKVDKLEEAVKMNTRIMEEKLRVLKANDS